jgi:hypothetical protein
MWNDNTSEICGQRMIHRTPKEYISPGGSLELWVSEDYLCVVVQV